MAKLPQNVHDPRGGDKLERRIMADQRKLDTKEAKAREAVARAVEKVKSRTTAGRGGR